MAAAAQPQLSQIFRDHQARVQALRDESESKRRAALSSVHNVSALLAENVNGGVAAIFSNQRQIEAEAKLLQSQVSKFSKQTTQWVQMIESFNNALKEIGDIENWAKAVERDMTTISTSLEYVYKNNPSVVAQQAGAPAPAPSPPAPAPAPGPKP